MAKKLEPRFHRRRFITCRSTLPRNGYFFGEKISTTKSSPSAVRRHRSSVNGSIDYSGPQIAKIADLKGKRVGVNALNDTSDSLITRYFADQGLASNEFTRMALGTSLGTSAKACACWHFSATKFPYPFRGFAVTEKSLRRIQGRCDAGCARCSAR
jgi:hypothetical protein